MKRILTAMVMITVLATASICAAALKGSADVVKASPAASSLTAKSGERVSFAIDLEISKTWHVYAHGDTNFIGVDLVTSEDFPLTELTAEYPEGHAGEFFGEVVYMIDGQERIKASALVPAGLAAGEHELTLGVTVQACDDKTCLAPVDLPVTMKLIVE